MKKRKVNLKLSLGKKTISSFDSFSVKGGNTNANFCNGLTNDNGCSGLCNGTFTCPTIGGCDTDGCVSQDEHLCEYTLYSACTAPTEPGITGC